MTIDAGQLGELIQRPLPLAYHPLYRFYEGGSLTRVFRGEPDRPDDWWSEDWVGSCTLAGNPDPDGRPQGHSVVPLPARGTVTLRELIEAYPEAMVGSAFAQRWGPIPGVLVKLLSPAGQVPLHAHPSREWAQRHLGSPYGKTEAWIILEAPGDGHPPPYAGVGFRGDMTREGFRSAVDRHDRAALRDSLHRTEIAAGEVYVAHAGVPHFLGPRISFIEVQEPSDHIVIPEIGPDADVGAATMGLGWDEALDMIDYTSVTRDEAFARARQSETVRRRHGSSREVGLLDAETRMFFDASRLDIEDELPVEDQRFYIGIVVNGEGTIEGDFGSEAVRRGQTFACPASLGHRLRAGHEPLTVIRAMGPIG